MARKKRETAELAEIRLKKQAAIQEHYKEFGDFLYDAMDHLGFATTAIQYDIGEFMANGPDYLMVQAQRGQAKSTVAAAFCVWSLIHKPATRILIVTSVGKTAEKMGVLVKRLILTMPLLEYMRPDEAAGDRAATAAFEVHHSLRRVDKSASVTTVGINGTVTGERSDLLLADDIESSDNAGTAMSREELVNKSVEFAALTTGQKHLGIRPRILYLGTPQSVDSIYNRLPAKGFEVRVWPGRYPNADQRKSYGDLLAPFITEKMISDPTVMTGGGLDGTQGKPVDTLLFPEERLQTIELAITPGPFQLQYMLNTQLMDADRYPLKLDKLITMRMDPSAMPLSITRGFTDSTRRNFSSNGIAFTMSVPMATSIETSALTGVMMYVDPAGGGANGDETGYAVTGHLNGNVYVLACGGVPGGFDPETLEKIALIAAEWKPNVIQVEKNMGYGTFRELLAPIIRKHHNCSIEDDYVTQQKELRIINTLAPVIGRGSLILNTDIVETDQNSTQKYDPAKRLTYSLFHQMARITRDRKALSHDDRLDALEGAVRYWQEYLTTDEDKAEQVISMKRKLDLIKNPFRLLESRPVFGPDQRKQSLKRFKF